MRVNEDLEFEERPHFKQAEITFRPSGRRGGRFNHSRSGRPSRRSNAQRPRSNSNHSHISNSSRHQRR